MITFLKHSIWVGILAATQLMGINTTQADIAFHEKKNLLSGEDVKDFKLEDLDGDNRLDVIWLDSNGNLHYKLQDNRAFVTVESLPGTRWKLVYDDNGAEEIIEFSADSGVIIMQENTLYNISRWEVSAQNILSFCRPSISGLNRTRCSVQYTQNHSEPNIMKGVQELTGQTWTAYRLVN